MLRRIAGSVALIAILATGVQAQVPVQFEISGCSGVNTFNRACNSSGSIGSFNGLTGTIQGGSSFQIWCVDEGDDILPFIPSGFYSAIETPFNAVDFSHVYQPGIAPLAYEKAASLTHFMTGIDDFVDPSNPASAHGTPLWGGNAQIQFAIWQLMGFDPQGATSLYNLDDVNHWISVADASSINPDNWVIISDVSTDGREQEFIANVAPEPGTLGMLAMGLTGLAGAGLRRRRRK